MKADDSDESKASDEAQQGAVDTAKVTPPPKPRRDSTAARTDARGGPAIPGAPRVPVIPADQTPARGADLAGRSEPPRPRGVSDAPRRQRSDTPARNNPASAGSLGRAETPSDRPRPSFPLPPAPVSLSEGNMPLVSRSTARSVPSPGSLRSDPAPIPGASGPAFPLDAPKVSVPRPGNDPARAAEGFAPAAFSPEMVPPPLAPAPPPPIDYAAAPYVPPSPPAEPEKPGHSVAILAMKIIAVGAPAPEPNDIEQDIEIHVDVPAGPDSEIIESSPHAAEPVFTERLTPEPVELSDADVAPDSGGDTPARAAAAAAPAVEVREETISIPPVEIEADTPVPEPSPTDEAKPPPPPRRKSTKPPGGKALPTAKKKQRRPWWEDVFGEEFVRAAPRANPVMVQREVDFIESSLGVAPGGVVLDLGCGAGHHAVELASRGYGLVGYDLSLYQLSLAAEVAKARGQKINFMQGDMREMAFEEMFDGVFSWNTSFGYFEEEKNLSVLERVFRALKPGGMLLIDVVNRDFVAAQSPSQNWYEGDGCVCMDDMALDFITSRLKVKRSVILDDGRTRECTYSIRIYSLHELGKLLHDVGFRVTEATGHPSVPGVFFGEHSPRIIVVAQKP